MPPLTFPIRTERLDLRPFLRADLDGFFAYWSLPEVARYVPWVPGDRVQATLALERRMGDVRLDQPGDILVLAVVEREHQTVIGEMMLRWFEGDHEQGEIGFAIHPDFHGRGLAGEAAAGVLDLGFGTLQLHRIIGRCDPRNDPSARVLRRLGMQQEAHFHHNEFVKGEWIDELVFAILDDDWRTSPDNIGAPTA